MQTAVSQVNPVQAAVVGRAKILWFIDSEFLNEGERADLFPAPFQSLYLLTFYILKHTWRGTVSITYA